MLRRFSILVLFTGFLFLQGCAKTPAIDAKTGGVLYHNTVLGFTISIAPEWQLPASTNPMPTFYESASCATNKRNCMMFTIKDNSTKAAEDPITFFVAAQKGGLQPILSTTMVPGAVVIATNDSVPDDTWQYIYHIFFVAEKKRYLLYASDSTLEQTVLSTLMVDAKH